MIEPVQYTRDDALLLACRADSRPRLAVQACSATEVVLGRGSKPELELNVEAIEADSIPLLRRRGGGCAVLLDPGNVIVSWVERVPGIGGSKAAFARLSTWICEVLAATGIPGVEMRGISDLAIGQHKVGGACIYRSKDLLYYSTTLLVAPQLDLVERYLKHPPREPDYRGGRAHRDFMGALRDHGAGDAVALAWDLRRRLRDRVRAL